jgi:hypothetical protein
VDRGRRRRSGRRRRQRRVAVRSDRRGDVARVWPRQRERRAEPPADEPRGRRREAGRLADRVGPASTAHPSIWWTFWPAPAVAGGRLWPTFRSARWSWPSWRTSGCLRLRHRSRGREVPASSLRERQQLEQAEGARTSRGRRCAARMCARFGGSAAWFFRRSSTRRRAREGSWLLDRPSLA